jgi:hypothetical protein
VNPELRAFLEAMQQDFHTTMLLAIGIGAVTLLLCVIILTWGWLASAKIMRQAEQFAANAQASMQAILAQTRRQP